MRPESITNDGAGSFRPLNATRPNSGAGVANPSRLTRCSFMKRKRPIGSLEVMPDMLA